METNFNTFDVKAVFNMMHDYFTKINRPFEVKLTIEINKYGNIVLKGRNEFFTLYKTSKNNGYLWRRTNDCSQIYPLNMKRKNIEHVFDTKRSYDINMSKFNTIEEVCNYFVNYIKKYRNYYAA